MAHQTTVPDHSASSSASSTASTYVHYDVFINHRGPDTKRTLASLLYRSLTSRGLRVFPDRQELVEGKPIVSQIHAAIQVSYVHIVILSPNYAQSIWCLDELVMIMNTGAITLPVFYDVSPSEVRWTGRDAGGRYVEALLFLEKKKTIDAQTGEVKPRHQPETIKNWRDALSRAAKISGIELAACNGDIGELLDYIVRRVLEVLPKTPLAVSDRYLFPKTPLAVADKYLFDVAKYPPGLGQKLQDLEKTVQSLQHQEAKVVGIAGVGGVGKTTLAKAYFNLNRSHYNESSFLFDVRENADKMSLNNLQRKLIKDLKQIDIKFQSHDEGEGILRRHLSSCHALIVLDDVDDIDQIEAFKFIKDVLHPDSLILVTSREKHVLKRIVNIRESSIYTLEVLSREDSRELFSLNAFTEPRPEFEHLIDGFLDVCDGLPLSLRVLGALLFDNSISYWEEQLKQLHQILPQKIQDCLKISYNSLNTGEKEIFLDIACFFKGGNRDRAIRIWGLVAIQNLENKCILGVDVNNKIKMHDHFRDLGRDIAKEASLPRRLWCATAKNIDELLVQSSGVSDVRGITMVPRLNIPNVVHSIDHVTGFEDFVRSVNTDALLSDYDADVGSFLCSEMPWYKRWTQEVFVNQKWKLLNNDRLRGIRNLQLVATEDSYLEGIIRKVASPHLIWLRWYKCPYSSLPLWIPMENLRVLEVAGSRLKTLWRHEIYQAPPELRELNIWAPLSEFPKSIGQLNHLERIVVDCIPPATPTLQILPEEFCALGLLKHLQLRRCSRMMSLPDSFGNLTNLEHIDLSYSSLEILPDSFVNLTKLKHLSLTWCGNLTISNVKEGICGLTELQHLDISGCAEVEDLPNLETLVSLEVIKAASCNKLKSIRGFAQLSKLRHLDISWCSELEELPGVEHYMSLEKLGAVGCPRLLWGDGVLEQLLRRLKEGLQI